MNSVCLRCGYCCRNMSGLVPKNENSNLSPEFIDKLEKEKDIGDVAEYIKDNTIEIGHRCKWLIQESFVRDNNVSCNSIAKCKVYDKRSEMCVGYMKNVWCNIGLITWRTHIHRGYELPDEIRDIIKEHPMYKLYF